MQPYSTTDMANTWKNSHFILLERSDFHMINNLSIVIYNFPVHILSLLSVDEILILRYVNWSISLRGLPFNVEMVPCCLKHMNSVLSEFI